MQVQATPVSDAGKTSAAVAPTTALGPELPATIVYVSGWEGETVVRPSVLVIDSSEGDGARGGHVVAARGGAAVGGCVAHGHDLAAHRREAHGEYRVRGAGIAFDHGGVPDRDVGLDQGARAPEAAAPGPPRTRALAVLGRSRSATTALGTALSITS
jgi:hypothetical protein